MAVTFAVLGTCAVTRAQSAVDGFNSGASHIVHTLAVQPDGKILVGDYFATLGGGETGTTTRNHFGRLTNSDAATQRLSVTGGGSAVTWSRSGAGPEVWRAMFESSTDGATYTSLGRRSTMTRIFAARCVRALRMSARASESDNHLDPRQAPCSAELTHLVGRYFGEAQPNRKSQLNQNAPSSNEQPQNPFMKISEDTMSQSELAKDRFNISRRIVILIAAAAALAVATPAAAQITYNVTTTVEDLCTPACVPGSLQWAIAAVNNGLGGGDLIVLVPGTYAITNRLAINKDVTIRGDALLPTVLDAGFPLRIVDWLLFFGGNNASIQNLTLQNGFNYGLVYEGNGVFSATGVTITGIGRTGFDAGDSGGSVFFTNSTIANNPGNGISVSCGLLRMTNVTASNNGVGLYSNCGQPIQVTNSLIVANGQDCNAGGSVLTGDASLDGDGSCVTLAVASGNGGFTTNNPGLSPLAANGGPTMTEAISMASPAFNAGDNIACPATDQRGFLRAEIPNDGFCDIGAYEFGAAAPVVGNTQTGPNVSVSPAPGVTVTFSNVTAAGDTTATTGGPLPPTGFRVDGLLYNISTTATYAGLVTICLPYSPKVDPSPLVFHYEGGGWVSLPITVDPVKQVVCGTASSLSPFAVFVTVPFGSFTARVEIERSHVLTIHGGDSFEVEGRGILGPASDGIAPSTEAVTLSLGWFSLTIPAGSFVKKIDKDEDKDKTDRDRDVGDRREDRHDRDDRITAYQFKGVIAGVSLSAEIEQGPKHTFRFQFEGQQANFGLVISPVTVRLAIGDDLGQVMVKADIDK